MDIIPAVVTFATCLILRLELGIVIGIAVNLLFLLYASARPSVHVTKAVVSARCYTVLFILFDRECTFHAWCALA